MTTFNIEMLPANEGDALWITYAKDGEPERHILIDCGRTTAYRTAIRRFENDPNLKLELFVLTHVDADHIAGAVKLLHDSRFGPDRVADVWYNGWPQLDGFESAVDVMGAQQGEYFGAVLYDREYSWNDKIEGDVVVVKPDGALPSVNIDGGLKLTLLSPTPGRLGDMRERWEKDLGKQDDPRRIPAGDWEHALEVLKRDRRNMPDVLSDEERSWPPDIEVLATSDFEADSSEPNGSSIAFLAEVGDKAVLFSGDAHAPVLEANINRLLEERDKQKLKLDAFKMSHHGSAANNSLALGELIECPLYLVSTNGSGHHHPDHEAIARMIWAQDSPVTFAFNYRSDDNLDWEDQAVQDQAGYKTIYPDDDKGLKVSL